MYVCMCYMSCCLVPQNMHISLAQEDITGCPTRPASPGLVTSPHELFIQEYEADYVELFVIYLL